MNPFVLYGVSVSLKDQLGVFHNLGLIFVVNQTNHSEELSASV